ncbi:MAG TPA: MFS transporter [Desulfobacterales bacterium]|nr:MFS transporter [Desulfobacterales bacterium]
MPQENQPESTSRDITQPSAQKFVILLGVVSLLSDMTYEGARSINGPFLALLGAGATVVATVAGLGELIGYALRLLSGYLTDQTKRYWSITLVGYALNLFAVPLLALAGRWEIAAALMLTERLGKAIRNPARDAMLSHAASTMGRGWGFGLHEAMDQLGAIFGPLIVAIVLFFQVKGGYASGYAILLIPAILALLVLLTGRYLYPQPHQLEVKVLKVESTGLSRPFWLYIAAVALIGAGYADFPLVAYHFKREAVMTDTWIPLTYAVAMGTDAVAALILGYTYDRLGIKVMVGATLLSAFFAPLVFLGGFFGAMTGMVLWGIGMGAQESVMRAAIADMVPSPRRASAYGIFQTGYGLFWFLGSLLMGLLYDNFLIYLIIFSVASQLLALPIFILVAKKFCVIKY